MDEMSVFPLSLGTKCQPVSALDFSKGCKLWSAGLKLGLLSSLLLLRSTSFLTSHLKRKLTKPRLAVNETLCTFLPDAEGYWTGRAV